MSCLDSQFHLNLFVLINYVNKTLYIVSFIDCASSPRPPLPPLFSLTIPKQQYQKSNKNKSQKVFTSACRDGTLKTNQTRWERHQNRPYILCNFANYVHHKTLCMHLAYSYSLNEQGTQHCSLQSSTDPYLPCSAAIKCHDIT